MSGGSVAKSFWRPRMLMMAVTTMPARTTQAWPSWVGSWPHLCVDLGHLHGRQEHSSNFRRQGCQAAGKVRYVLWNIRECFRTGISGKCVGNCAACFGNC